MTPLTVYGELTADGGSIVIMATGHEHRIAEAAKLIGLLTPLVKRSDPPGALVIPATWASVVQLAARRRGDATGELDPLLRVVVVLTHAASG